VSKPPIIRAAAVQAGPIILDLHATVAKACDLISEAAQNGAKLVVFPEMFIPTYVDGSVWGRGLAMFGSKKATSAFLRLWENSVEIGDASTERLCQAARENGVTIAIGLNEKINRGRTLYNTILYIGENGAIWASIGSWFPPTMREWCMALATGAP
jgi:nitrilase